MTSEQIGWLSGALLLAALVLSNLRGRPWARTLIYQILNASGSAGFAYVMWEINQGSFALNAAWLLVSLWKFFRLAAAGAGLFTPSKANSA